MGKVDGRRATRRICCKTLRGRNRKLPRGECWLAEVVKIRTGRFGSRHFWNLEKTHSGRPRENRFSASQLIRIIRSASFGSSWIVPSSTVGCYGIAAGLRSVGMPDGYGDLVGLAISQQRVYRHFGDNPHDSLPAVSSVELWINKSIIDFIYLLNIENYWSKWMDHT